ncbi:class I SAM-dependent methyltransferase [Novosphingobium mathurense]|uniref:S-adenosylmethionine-diacylgycerolhomoserine-N-methlytransferase n=1 Tax=Novosphingobium mathurense TaxID=428990 RepID=A0A1U6H437_9SPHN|nr:class I SAM-dependent methyltransferase [Novosphingobium mathurense]SLJ90496.1 S-adenosylmethionine-diacylgycerolhomoserine-N-methlytransferase [Novosphingobium mathurense]
MTGSTPATDHAALMDRVYRGQRHIYDLTRKYYLFGRDRLIDELECRASHAVLELGCGTGRNLQLIARRWPGVQCHGLDISAEMLKNARKRLGFSGHLALGDATCFDARNLFGREGFDRVVLSYALSMIPGWEAALEQAVAALAPGGSVRIVDFGDLSGLPTPLAGGLRKWLAHFHVTPRVELQTVCARIANDRRLKLEHMRGPLGYYQMVHISR